MSGIHRFFFCSLILFNLMLCADPVEIISDSAVVFEKPDFDSPVIIQLPMGMKIEASQKAFGIFHRVRLSDGRMGYLDDSEFRFLNPKTEKTAKNKVTPTLGAKPPVKVPLKSPTANSKGTSVGKNTEKVPKKTKPFVLSSFSGISMQYVSFKEETMGAQPTANCLFYGFKMIGTNLFVEGDAITEFNVDILPAAPGYYQKATGRGADGWVLHSDMLFQEQFSQGRNIMTFFGFGPMFRFSSINVELVNGSQKNAYSLQDMVLGAVFDIGFGAKAFGNQFRAEYKYYWEKTQYAGVGVSYLISL